MLGFKSSLAKEYEWGISVPLQIHMKNVHSCSSFFLASSFNVKFRQDFERITRICQSYNVIGYNYGVVIGMAILILGKPVSIIKKIYPK